VPLSAATAAVTPKHYRPFTSRVGTWRPDVQAQTILVIALDGGICLRRKHGYRAEILRRLVAEFDRIADSGPGLRLGGSHESHFPARRGSIGNALERVNIPIDGSTNLTGCRLHDCTGRASRVVCKHAGSGAARNEAKS